MELTKKLLAEIAEIFRSVQYGDITFHLSPEKRTLDYDVKTTGKIVIDNPGYVANTCLYGQVNK